MELQPTPGVSQKQNRWYLDAGLLAVFAIAAIKLAVHLYASRNYGYFRDELYYLACGDHLDWGYVDQPPLVALIVKIERLLFGDSLIAIRFVSARQTFRLRRGRETGSHVVLVGDAHSR